MFICAQTLCMVFFMWAVIKKRKKIIIVAFIVLFFLISTFLFVISGTNILAAFKKGERLNYHKNVTEIIITCDTSELYKLFNTREIKINDREVIEKIFDYINSLELVRGQSPLYSNAEDMLIFTLRFDGEMYQYENNAYGELDESIVFTTQYLIITGKPQGSTHYYVKNAGFNIFDKSTKFSRYLYGLIG